MHVEMLLSSLSTAALELLEEECKQLENSNKHVEAREIAARSRHLVREVLHSRKQSPCGSSCGHL